MSNNEITKNNRIHKYKTQSMMVFIALGIMLSAFYGYKFLINEASIHRPIMGLFVVALAGIALWLSNYENEQKIADNLYMLCNVIAFTFMYFASGMFNSPVFALLLIGPLNILVATNYKYGLYFASFNLALLCVSICMAIYGLIPAELITAPPIDILLVNIIVVIIGSAAVINMWLGISRQPIKELENILAQERAIEAKRTQFLDALADELIAPLAMAQANLKTIKNRHPSDATYIDNAIKENEKVIALIEQAHAKLDTKP